MSIKFGFKTSDIVRNCKIFLSRPNFCWYMVIRLQEIVKINFAKALPAYEICYYEFKDVIICMNESKIEKPCSRVDGMSCFILFIEISSTYFINLIIHKTIFLQYQRYHRETCLKQQFGIKTTQRSCYNRFQFINFSLFNSWNNNCIAKMEGNLFLCF